MALNIQVLSKETDPKDTAKIALDGRLDSNTYSDLEKLLEPVLPSVKTLILDLSKLQFISSAGIRVLFTARNELAKRDGTVLLTNLQPQIVKVLEIIQALPGVSIFRDAEEMDNYLATMQRKVLEGK